MVSSKISGAMYLQRMRPLKPDGERRSWAAAWTSRLGPGLSPCESKRTQAAALFDSRLRPGTSKATPPLGSHAVVGWDVDGVGG